jgi:hypothetical protein
MRMCIAIADQGQPQSAKHGVIAPDKHHQTSSSYFVERHVWFLGDPEAMEEDGQLPCHRNSPVLSLLATSSCETQPLPKC